MQPLYHKLSHLKRRKIERFSKCKSNQANRQNRLTIPSRFFKILSDADVAELADALDSGSSESFFHMGSSPFICTKKMTTHLWVSHFFYCRIVNKGLERVGIAGKNYGKQSCLRQEMDTHLLPHWRDSIKDAEQVPSSAPQPLGCCSTVLL